MLYAFTCRLSVIRYSRVVGFLKQYGCIFGNISFPFLVQMPLKIIVEDAVIAEGYWFSIRLNLWCNFQENDAMFLRQFQYFAHVCKFLLRVNIHVLEIYLAIRQILLGRFSFVGFELIHGFHRLPDQGIGFTASVTGQQRRLTSTCTRHLIPPLVCPCLSIS